MLPTHAELLELIDEYNHRFPDEKESGITFHEFVKRKSTNSVFSRNNFDGHFTASAFLMNESRTKLLFLTHKKLNRWLQPGGHIDETDTSILGAALREITEETGLQRSAIELVIIDIFDLDAHIIPDNPIKNEPAHVHYDVRYLFEVTNESGINVNKSEAEELAWLSLEDVQNLTGFERVVEKLKILSIQ
jgi:8-oxo-dGTP pyrophosphatase MutT (NUDIX family)